jgi:predicted flavoprotein YhiN
LWESLVLASGIAETKWADLSKTQLKLIQSIDKRNFSNGKVLLEEFVTAGGINLKEINFKTMESKLHETCISQVKS